MPTLRELLELEKQKKVPEEKKDQARINLVPEKKISIPQTKPISVEKNAASKAKKEKWENLDALRGLVIQAGLSFPHGDSDKIKQFIRDHKNDPEFLSSCISGFAEIIKNI
jgi:hypothetical protein